MHTYTYTGIHLHTQTHLHTYTSTHIHTRLHTYTLTPTLKWELELNQGGLHLIPESASKMTCQLGKQADGENLALHPRSFSNSSL